jgi:hypothetical protein
MKTQLNQTNLHKQPTQSWEGRCMVINGLELEFSYNDTLKNKNREVMN